MSCWPLLEGLWAKHHYKLASVTSGVVLIAAFPPFEQGYLAWVALLPLLWVCLKAPPRQAFFAGLLFGLPLNLYLNLYLATAILPFLSIPLVVVALTLLVIYISLFNAFFALAVSLIHRLKKNWFTALAIPSLWLGMEYLRSLGFLAYNVGYLGYTQWGYPIVLSFAAVYGYWGIPFILVLFQSILLLSYQRQLRGKILASTVTLFILLSAAGFLLPHLQPADKSNRPLMAGLIQGNSTPEEILSEAGRQTILKRYLALSRQAVKQEPTIELIVWPETVVDVDFSKEPAHLAPMVELAEDLNVAILYGARLQKDEQLFNSIALIYPGQEEITTYNKHRLVPFVEYFPMEHLLNQLLDLDLLLGRMTAGEEITIFMLSEIPLAGVICFESYFGDHTRLFAQKGSRHLFVPTNDVWFGNTIGLDMHAQVGAIRAAEMGIGVTQVANSGITISFDYRGRELFRSGKSVPGIFPVSLDLAQRETIYNRFGDYFPIFWIGFLTVFGIILAGRHQRSKYKSECAAGRTNTDRILPR